MDKKIIIVCAAFLLVAGLAIILMQNKPAPQHVAAVERPAVAPPQQKVIEEPQQKPSSNNDMEFGDLPGKIRLFSPQVKAGEKISLAYTCYQKNVSPPLGWSDLPQGTKSTVIFFEKPEADKTRKVFWTIYNIPVSVMALAEGLPKMAMVGDVAGQGVNDSGNIGYYGPCAPKGEQPYTFTIFALDIMLPLPGGADKNALLNAMKGHVLDKGILPVTHYYRL